jgi:hypothetical protein
VFIITMPKTFAVGETAECRINRKPTRVTWRDERTLVIEPGDSRRIKEKVANGDLVTFVCGDRARMKCKILIFADSFQTIHQEQVRRQGYDPAWAWVCREFDFPDDGEEAPDELLQAMRFAREAKDGDTGVVDPEALKRTGRKPVVASFKGSFDGRPCLLRYLVGFTEPA